MRSGACDNHGFGAGSAGSHDCETVEEDRSEGTGTSPAGVKSEKDSTHLTGNCGDCVMMTSAACDDNGDDARSATSRDSGTNKEDKGEQQVTDLIFPSVTLSGNGQKIVGADDIDIAEDVKDVGVIGFETGRLLRPRKARALQQEKVVNRQASQVGRRGRGRGKKGSVESGDDDSTAPTAVGKEVVIEVVTKSRASGKKGKRKTNRDAAVIDLVEQSQERTAVDGVELIKESYEGVGTETVAVEVVTETSPKTRPGSRTGKRSTKSERVVRNAGEASKESMAVNRVEPSDDSPATGRPTGEKKDVSSGASMKTWVGSRRAKGKKTSETALPELVEPSVEKLLVDGPELTKKGHNAAVPTDAGEDPVVEASTRVRVGRGRGKRKVKSEAILADLVEHSSEMVVADGLELARKGADSILPAAVIEVSSKIMAVSRRGKRKVNTDTSVADIVETTNKMTVVEVDAPVKETVVVGVMEPVSCGQDAVEIPENNVKRRQKGRSTTSGAGVVKRRWRSRKPQEPEVDGDPCPSPTVVAASGSEGPAEVLLPVSGRGRKKLQPGQIGQKKAGRVVTGQKVVESISVSGKSKRAKGSPCVTVSSRGATIKTLFSIKDQACDEVLFLDKDKPISPEAGKCNSKVLEVSTVDHAICDNEAEGIDKIDGAGASASCNEESPGGVGSCMILHATNSFQVTEGAKDLDSGVVGEDVSSGVTEGGDNKGSEKGIDSDGAEAGARKSWVLCDDCNKWRCIPVELADQIESTNATWSCRENPDQKFRDCAVPQEKSNAEINAELQISEVSVCDEGDDKDVVDSKSMNLRVANEENKPAVWKRIRHNIFQHRRRKVLEIDEMMVCQCTPPDEGGVGCGDNCLNRMLSIECVAEQCPCAEACSNQQFQNSTYAPIEMYRCGKKGFGLRVMENVSKGTFIIEYVGEVLDVAGFEIRQQEYARKGQKHFYFMTLNSNEVIDACSKGNFGRFINHSCEPNCRTEKWMVNGEVCIGLFAVRDIAKYEEVTFDYNYVRVCGAAAKKCECGSSQCRGFIGGDPLTPKAVMESDSEDEEDLEPIMIENNEDEDAYVNENKMAPCKKPRAESEFQEATVRTSGIKRKFLSVKEKAQSTVKRVKTSSSARRNGSMNFRGLTLDVGGGRHEGTRAMNLSDVQEKLDDMLDRNGGLRKRRDAAKHYLKLLVLTSASGDNRKDATACSVRDLSLLLEALLRTTSRTVLSDIMNKNGLRMLHNLIKQLRRQWDKTPILRKLIKVLDLLASQRLLTVDLINSSPPCSGMESFSESLFMLTRHMDSEVVQMVRRFRSTWMSPRSQLYDQPYKQPVQSLSPVKVQQTDQMNAAGSRFQSPQHSKQASSIQPHTGLETSRAASSVVPGLHVANLPPCQSQNGLVCIEEGAIPKEDEKVSTNPHVVGDDSSPGKLDQESKKTRKRPSRWDAQVKVENCSEGHLDHAIQENMLETQGSSSCLSESVACTLAPPHVSQGLPQFQFKGPRQFHSRNRPFAPKYKGYNGVQSFRRDTPQNMPSVQQCVQVCPGAQPEIAAQSAPLQHPGQVVGLPGLAVTLTNTLMSGPPQMHPGSSSVVAPRGMMPTGHLPGPPMLQMGPPMMMSSGPPGPHPGFQQILVPNGIHFGGPALPGRVFPLCPSQMGPGHSPVQAMHGSSPHTPMGAGPIPIGYPVGTRPPPMLPSASYVQWGSPSGVLHFAGPPSFPIDRSHRHCPPPAWPDKKIQDGVQLSSTFGPKGVHAANLVTQAHEEPEPPVPGLSPPPVPVPVNCDGSDSHDCRENANVHQREYFQGWRPNYAMLRAGTESTFQSDLYGMRYSPKGQTRDRESSRHNFGPGDADTRDEKGGFHSGEYWETPEAEGFREDVFSLVTSQVQKYKMRTRDLERFCSKLADVIVRKEVAKYTEHKNQGSDKKVIVKSKLLEKVESYVENQVDLYWRKIEKSHRS